MKPYTYKAKLVRVVDGDTLDLEVDLGFRMTTRQRFRLMGYNAPETRGPEKILGAAASARLAEVLGLSEGILITTHKGDAFGRWLCDMKVLVRLNETSRSWYDVVPNLIKEGWGVAWDGRGRRPAFLPEDPYPVRSSR
jgi:micrococcal nuclease